MRFKLWGGPKATAPDTEVLCPSCGHSENKHGRGDEGMCFGKTYTEYQNRDGTYYTEYDRCRCNLSIHDIELNISKGITWENRDTRSKPGPPGSGVPPKISIPQPPPPPTPRSMTRTLEESARDRRIAERQARRAR